HRESPRPERPDAAPPIVIRGGPAVNPPGVSLLLREHAEDVRQDAAVAVRRQLLRRVHANVHPEPDRAPILALRTDLDRAARLQRRAGALDVEDLAPGEAEARDRLAGPELQRQHAHVHEVAAMDALEALGDDGPDAEQERALRRPVARGAGAVLLAREH